MLALARAGAQVRITARRGLIARIGLDGMLCLVDLALRTAALPTARLPRAPPRAPLHTPPRAPQGDPQNVHDTGVNACLRATFARLRTAQQGRALPSVGDIAAALRSFCDPRLLADAEAVLRATRRGGYVAAIGSTDEECLRRVWARADDPRNTLVRSRMRQAVLDSLVDCWESDPAEAPAARRIVCVSGRAARFLAALVLLDWDKRNWDIKKIEQIRSEAFACARAAIAACAQAALASADPGRRRAGLLHAAATAAELGAAGDVPESDLALFEAEAAAAIDRAVGAHLARLGCDAATIEGLKKEARAAL